MFIKGHSGHAASKVTNVSFWGTLLRSRNCKPSSMSPPSPPPVLPTMYSSIGAHVQSAIPLTGLLYKAEVRKRKREGGKKQGPTLKVVMCARIMSML